MVQRDYRSRRPGRSKYIPKRKRL